MAKDAYKFVEDLIGPMTVARLFRNHRTGRDMNQKDLAEKLGVTVGFISNIETGKKRISLDTLLEYCKILDESEIVWMSVFFEEEARRFGKKISSMKIEDDKKRKRA